jgi:hypothetical protein
MQARIFKRHPGLHSQVLGQMHIRLLKLGATWVTMQLDQAKYLFARCHRHHQHCAVTALGQQGSLRRVGLRVVHLDPYGAAVFQD